MGKVLDKSFFNRSTHAVARELMGKMLVRQKGKKIIRSKITEVEVYDGFADQASHASRGKTKRNIPMFNNAGRWYVYLVYGMHWMLNIVTREKGYPAAILIRGVEGILGPARVTKALGVSNIFNNRKAEIKTGLWIEEGAVTEKMRITRTARIGVDYAGPVWANKKWRLAAISHKKKTRRI